MYGLLNLYKPVGWTSRDAVNRVQRQVRPVKVGHAGTLDPLACGVLLTCLGPATRLVEHLHRLPKRYRATFLLGRHTPCDDLELPPVELPNAPVPDPQALRDALPGFLGEIDQVPPAYSAVKRGGEKSYDLARRGVAVELEPRRVRIDSVEVVEYAYPCLTLDIRCGAGVYIRSLGRDLAATLGTVAVMSALERTEVGPFLAAEGLNAAQADLAAIQGALQPAALAVADLPRRAVSASEADALRRGRPVDAVEPQAGEVAALDPAGELVALVGWRKRDGKLWPLRVFGAV